MLSTGTCEMCKGQGLVIEERLTGIDVYGEAKPLIYTKPCPLCNGGHVAKVQKVMKRANIPHSFYDSTLKDFMWDAYIGDDGKPIDLKQQKKFVESFVENFEKWNDKGLGLYLWSSIKGTGKTFLASCICNELMQKYHMVTKFVSVSELISLDQQGKKDNFEKNPIEVLSECYLLVIDDLGQQKTGENYLDDILFRIIDSRYQNKLTTIVTSNIELKKLRVDDRVSDRLNKMCQPIPLPNFSVRQRESYDMRRDFLKEMGLMQ